MRDFNIPTIRANRKLVGSKNGGLCDPSPLVFDPHWGTERANKTSEMFGYPRPIGIKRPANEEDIAFMTVMMFSFSNRR